MIDDRQIVRLGRHSIELSSLDKVLYPDEFVVKAEVVAYYLQVAQAMLRHIRRRPLTLVYYPDGIARPSYRQQCAPDWAPDWIVTARATSGGDPTAYMVAEREADIVWLADLDALEIHARNSRIPTLDRPDRLVFDLDPYPGQPFPEFAALADELRAHIEAFGYQVFVKTSGRNGLHLVAPVHPEWTPEACTEAAVAVAASFVHRHPKQAAIRTGAEPRADRMLIGVDGNRRGRTLVAPYSLRGIPGAPVSMPLTWEMLEETGAPADFNIGTVVDHLRRHGDVWESLEDAAVPLHTERGALVPATPPDPGDGPGGPAGSETYRPERSPRRTSDASGRGAAQASGRRASRTEP